MKEREFKRLESELKEIIREWYLHIDEYPQLYKYIASSLAKSGAFAEKNQGAV